MKTPLTLGLYGAGLAALFVASYATAGAIIPQDASAAWKNQTEESTMSQHTDTPTTRQDAPAVPGLSVEQNGYLLRNVSAPETPGAAGTLSFQLVGPHGDPVTEYIAAHTADLHLIVVRSDGSQFRHVHPTHEGNGTWSIPWQWDAAGSYRVFADFVPLDLDEGVTLTSTVSVAGTLQPVPVAPASATATVGDLTVTLAGSLAAGEESTLTFTVTRDGAPVTALEPYLGAYGHLVALREGDLGYLHVHPMGEPGDGVTAPGPDITFMAQAPTPGAYFLYLDVQLDGDVQSIPFVVTAA